MTVSLQEFLEALKKLLDSSFSNVILPNRLRNIKNLFLVVNRISATDNLSHYLVSDARATNLLKKSAHRRQTN